MKILKNIWNVLIWSIHAMDNLMFPKSEYPPEDDEQS